MEPSWWPMVGDGIITLVRTAVVVNPGRFALGKKCGGTWMNTVAARLQLL